MKKKMILVCVLAAAFGAMGFAQAKHSAGDMSINVGYGMNEAGIGNLDKVMDSLGASDPDDMVKQVIGAFDKSATAVVLGLGVGFEYYILDWLNVGAMAYFNGGALMGQSQKDSNTLGVGAPLYLGIPISANVNVPVKGLEWIYVGLGAQFDILLADFLDGLFDMDEINDTLKNAHEAPLSTVPLYKIAGPAKGQVTLFQDIGFDLIRYNANGKRKGGRFTFRLYEGLGAFSEGAWEKGLGIGFFWNSGNFKLN
jgi:hypothetical protein